MNNRSKITYKHNVRIFKIITVFLFTQLIAGCVTPQFKQTLQRPVFPIEEYKKLSASGTGIVEGQGFLKTLGGDVKKAAGEEIVLNPVTSYSNFWYENSYLKGHPLSTYDQRYEDYWITTIADGDGKFKFSNIPPGEYYAVTKVTWKAATGYQGALQDQGGLIAKKITVQNNQTTRIILTR